MRSGRLSRFYETKTEVRQWQIPNGQKTPDHGFIWNSIEHYFYWKENRQRHEVNRKKYLRLCILGAFGAHQFYARRPVLGVLYLATFWTGFSAAMTIVDAVIAAPMKPDENGSIWL